MKESNKFMLLVFLTFSISIFYYIELFRNIKLWLYDIRNCFNDMYFFSFLIDHMHIITYIFLFLLFSILLVNGIIKNSIYLSNIIRFYWRLKKQIHKNKNSILINTKKPTAFNIFNKIFLSKSLMKNLTFSELKIVLLHEKIHKQNKDFYKMLFINLTLNFLPDLISSRLKNKFSLLIEHEVDKKVIEKVNPEIYASVLLKTYKINLDVPQINSYVKTRVESILYEKDIFIKYKYFIYSILALVSLSYITHILRICFCGM